MKSGLVASGVLHATILGWGLVSLGGPEPLDATNSEAMPVELVPFSDLSSSVEGDREAELGETPAPAPTETPEELAMPADNVGENEVDLDTAPSGNESQVATRQTAAAPDEPPPPPPTPESARPESAPSSPPEPAPEPAPEPEPQRPSLPSAGPTPTARPDAPASPEEPPSDTRLAAAESELTSEQRQTESEASSETQAEREERRREMFDPDAVSREIETSRQAEEQERFDADEIAALLNRQESTGGGARRSEAEAAFGGSETTGAQLAQTDIDALRGQIQRCWSPPSGVQEAASLTVSIHMQLGPNGELETPPQLARGGGGTMAERAANDAALRAVQACAPYNLPAEKYAAWSNIIVNFDPSRMF